MPKINSVGWHTYHHRRTSAADGRAKGGWAWVMTKTGSTRLTGCCRRRDPGPGAVLGARLGFVRSVSRTGEGPARETADGLFLGH